MSLSSFYPCICVYCFAFLYITLFSNFSLFRCLSFSLSISLCASLSHTKFLSLSASFSPSSHTLCRHTVDFPGMMMRLKSGLRLFCPCRQRMSMSNLMHVNSQEEWCIKAHSERETHTHTHRERERERQAGEIPSVHCYSRLHLNIVAVVSNRIGVGTGGTLTNWGTHTQFLRAHVLTFRCTCKQISQTYICNTCTCLHKHIQTKTTFSLCAYKSGHKTSLQ